MLKRPTILNFDEDTEQLELLLVGVLNGTVTLEKVWQFLLKFNIFPTLLPRNFTPKYLSKTSEILCPQKEKNIYSSFILNVPKLKAD